jgi:flagellin-specific chaperone FliS
MKYIRNSKKISKSIIKGLKQSLNYARGRKVKVELKQILANSSKRKISRSNNS